MENMENLIEIYAKMINEGEWDENRVPPQIKEDVMEKKKEMEGDERR